MQHNQHIAELGPRLHLLGIRQVVICPGSRNAPLTQLFTADKHYSCHSIVDERSAGFVALGMARELGEPVAVVTTSGTAVLNLAPALAEAFHQNIPLVALTADRPLEVIPRFNNQWLDQEAPYYTFSKGFLQLPGEVTQREEMEQMMVLVERLVCSASESPAGPVHINVTLAEPLYDKLPAPMLEKGMPVPGKRMAEVRQETDEAHFPEVTAGPDRKLLVLAGMGSPNEPVREKLERLLHCRQAAVVAENIANLPGEGFCANPDLILAGTGEKEREKLRPDLVISFGGQVVSKRLKLFLQSRPDLKHTEITGDVLSFMERLTGQDPPGEGFRNRYQEAWDSAGSAVLARARKKMDALAFCNLSVTDRILSALPEDAVLHLGNSGAIRYSQLSPRRTAQHCYANRGTSGIDGCVSTAVGAAMVSGRMHVLLVGDLSFVYDSNAMWNRNFPENLRIVVINDGGGGIFRLLDGPDKMDFFEEFSVTHHPVSLEMLGQSFGRVVRRAAGFQELEQELADLLQPGSTGSVLEVDTSGSENSLIFKDYLDFNH
ncbi:MAG: 2-succinyl-5-enolpyruvyl-6-hydroxy-3-cyclohexene-1-carboxylic-acid synthase [Bacteroidota bacterium]